MPIAPEDLDVAAAFADPLDPASLIAPPGCAPQAWQTYAPTEFRAFKPAPGRSPDLDRVLALPRRAVPGADTEPAYVEWSRRTFGVTRPPPCECPRILQRYGRPPRACLHTLNFTQARSLHELWVVGGLFGVIGVGFGKTLLGLLAPLALRECRKALLLMQVGDLEQMLLTYDMAAQHFRVPSLVVHARVNGKEVPPKIVASAPQLHVLPYSRLQATESSDLIEHLAPDFIIADECDRLRNIETATVRRFLRRFQAAPATRFAGWTGSMTDSSIKEYWHLAALALRHGSPLPLDKLVVEEWANALDPDPCPADPGSLLALCDPGEHVHQGFHRRLRDTMGVILTTESAVRCELVIEEKPAPAIPPVIQAALASVREGVRPDGEELAEASEIQQCAREVAQGFYYEWWYPRGEPRELIERWFDARKAYKRAVRYKLQDAEEHLDSEKLAQLAAQRFYGELAPGTDKRGRPLPVWNCPEWPAWRDVKALVRPESRGVRLDDYLARDAAAWATSHRGVVWYHAREFGAWVAEISGLPQHVGGPKAAALIGRETGDRSIIASIKAHGRGRDGLQRLYDDQLIASPPANATGWEQLLGRLVRTGQEAARVRALYYAFIPELRSAVEKALIRAEYVSATMGLEQKLLVGIG